MSFADDFEKKVNEEMHEGGQPGPAPTEMEDADMALKKKGGPQSEVLDHYDKKDCPPRFSTLFGAGTSAPPPAPPRTPREYLHERYPEPRKRSGVHMPLALFIVLMVALFFESTIIFAYTIIGLYNNAPARLFPWAGQGAAVATICDTHQQPAINIAPNFVMPGQGDSNAITEMLTINVTPSAISTSTTSTSTSTTSMSTSTANASSQAAVLASEIAGILGSIGLGTSTTSSPIALVTIKPTPSTVTSVKVITQDPSGNPITNEAAPTVTQTTFVDPPKSSSTTSQEEIVIHPTTTSQPIIGVVPSGAVTLSPK